MIAKEKAIELVKKFTEVDGYDFNIKQCSLIAVDEVLDNLEDHTGKDIKYWEEIKQEIEKL